jgi:type IV pilus biogenesis protein CpaD/CtpE
MRSLVPILLITLGVACTAKESGTPDQSDTATAAVTASSTTETPISSTESAVAPEVNPPGDIPDTQAFVKYTNAAGGYQLEVPEGWARTENGTDVTFVNKFDGVKVHVASPSGSAAPTAASARANEVKQIQSQGHAVTITGVLAINLPAGKAVVIKYTSNSDPNPVTNKRVRLENVTYLYYKNGKEAQLTVWAPLGADNVDQWNRMSKSFRWL